MAESQLPRVVIAGTSDVGAEAVARGVIRSARDKQQDDTLQTPTTCDDETEAAGMRAFPVVFDNAYYTANVHLCLAPRDADLREVLATEHAATCALVMTFDASEPASFSTAVELWSEVMDSHGEALEAKICVAHNATFAPDEEELLSECLAWCADNFVEFVRATDAELADIGVNDGEDYPRVFAALETVMWPNMQLKERDAVGNAKRSTEQSMASSDSNTKSCSQQESDRATDKQPEVNDDCAEDASSPSPLAESDVAVLCDSTLGDATKEAGGEDSRSREREMASVLASVLKAEADDDTKDEVNSSPADFDLNSWIGKIQGMRESAANLSDDERRNRASDLALQLMSSLDLGDDSD